jgi:hypothetical protein
VYNTFSIELAFRITCQSSVEAHQITPFLFEDVFVEEEDSHAASASANQRVDNRKSNNIGVPGLRNRCLKLNN